MSTYYTMGLSPTITLGVGTTTTTSHINPRPNLAATATIGFCDRCVS